MTANGYGASFGVRFKIKWLCNSVNIPKTMNCYSLNGRTVWHVNYIPIELGFFSELSAALCILQVSFFNLCGENFYLPTNLLVRSH